MRPIVPIWLLLPWVLLALALIWRSYKRSGLNGKRIAVLFCLEILCLATLLAVLLQPIWRTSKPKEGAHRIVLLGDLSRSMSIRDMPNAQSRRECLASMQFKDFSQRVETYAFADEIKRVSELGGNGFLPGSSPIGRHLEGILEDEGRSLPMGALVLLSDGVCNSGPGVLDVAKKYMRHGIPISCVGIGGAGDNQDFGVSWKDASLKIQRDEACTLTAIITGTKAAELTVSLSEAGIELEKKKVQFKGMASAVDFIARPRAEGFHSYKVTLESSEKEARLDNNAAFAAVEALPPPTFRILFLLGGLDWEQRFINQFATANPQFKASIITAVTDKNYISTGFPENATPPRNSFPDNTAFYDDFDIVCLDTRAVHLLDEKGLHAIRAFVENKGGGLLLRGPIQNMPPVLMEMLPASDAQIVQTAMPAKLKFCPEAMPLKNANGMLAFQEGIFLRQLEALEPLKGLKKSARPMALLDSQYGNAQPLVAGLPFGAGRVVMSGLESTWRWRLAGNKIHDAWWTSVFQWLAEAAKPRVKELNGRLAEAGHEYALELSVLDDEFNPAPDATVEARIACPDGTVQQISLEAAEDEAGRYSALLYPETEGEYRIQYSIRLPNRTLSKEAFFVASPAGHEMEETSFNEALLRDVSRITGGRYFPYGEYASNLVPLSKNIPAVKSTRHLASTWAVALAFAASAIILCLLRRRLGLK